MQNMPFKIPFFVVVLDIVVFFFSPASVQLVVPLRPANHKSPAKGHLIAGEVLQRYSSAKVRVFFPS